MKRWTSTIPAWIVAICGCGTLYNNEIGTEAHPDSFRFYGGVRKDLEGFKDVPALSAKAENVPGAKVQLAAAVASFPLELGMSALGDTLLMPITVAGMIMKPDEPPPKTAQKRKRADTKISDPLQDQPGEP